jgi:hypothetical protein
MSAAVLLTLNDLSQELTIGVTSAQAIVRTLSRVTLSVRARELVVVAGARGAGERALLSVAAGDRRGVTGTRVLQRDVRLRAARIRPAQARALIWQWDESAMAPAPVSSNCKAPVTLMLLDVGADTARAETFPAYADGERLRRWTLALRNRGGSILMAASQSFVTSLQSGDAPPAQKHVREAGARMRVPSIRVITMHCGRLVDTDTA